MIVDDLPEDVRTSFMNGYNFSAAFNARIDAGTRASEEDEDALLRDTAASQSHPGAFWDGRALHAAITVLRYSDNAAEYRENEDAYDQTAAELNEKYGDIVLVSSEVVEGAFGLRGHRDPGVRRVETWERQPDGSTTHVVDNREERIAREDAEFRHSRGIQEPET